MRRFLTSFFRLALRIFFKRIEVVGPENIPEREPVIFAVNHPNGLVDPLFVLCFAPRDVSFLAKAPLFRTPVIGYLVRALDAIPVYRKQDQTAGSNEETFARATEILQRGGGIAIFPEGATHSDPSMRELKTGAARIALGASLPSIKVVPTGIYYTAKHVFRSEALVWFGKPVAVESNDVSEESVRALTARIDKALDALTLQADSRSALELVERAETIFSAGRDLPLAEELELRQRFVDGYHYLHQRDPARLARLEGLVRQIQTESLVAPRLDAGTIARVVILFPLALIGALIHYPAYRLIGVLASHFSRGESELIATVKFVSALLIYPLTWIAVAILFFFGVAPLAALAAIVVLPLLGYIALLVFEDIDEAIGRTRALLHRSRAKLAQQRDSIRAELLAIGDEIGRSVVGVRLSVIGPTQPTTDNRQLTTAIDTAPLRIFVGVAVLAGLTFAFVTPPFQTPDEVGHFWRATAIAYGTILPPRADEAAHVPDGIKLFVYVMLPRDGKITREQFRTSLDVGLNDEIPREARFPAEYTPVPYVPQITAALLGRIVNLPPVVIFYLGRILNLGLLVSLVAMAIRVAPFGKWIFCAAALLPMTLFLAASWSPDAATIALAFLFTAMILRKVAEGFGLRRLAAAFAQERSQATAVQSAFGATAIVGVLLGLSKPAYFLIALLALLIPARRMFVATIVIAATLIGSAMAMSNAARAHTPRSDVTVDSAAQRRCLVEKPLHFAGVAVRHVRQYGFEYAEQMVGRLGLLEIRLPAVIIWSELLLLLLAAWASGGSLPVAGRALAILIFVATVGGILGAFYIGYSRSCDVIEGIQGRYLLPILPLLLLSISFPFSRDRVVAVLTVAVSVVATAVGVFAVASHYYY